MLFNSMHQGPKCVSMTWRASSASLCQPGMYICNDECNLDREDHEDPANDGKCGNRAHGLYMFVDNAEEAGPGRRCPPRLST
jgi:hypothetical protein